MARPAPEPIRGLICFCLGLLLALLPSASPAKDLSGETFDILRDLMAPYRGDTMPAMCQHLGSWPHSRPFRHLPTRR
ncbi:hypothetical protein A8950_0886 [Dongia mobilis]|uniref:Uncharacterized protein n=1 Tax=Dongia mobilis TaxID=578943 RepID=A0A4R6WRV5_9PROT|nr:hypothetical protein A8950_0886 [Dongia mobilis]